MTDLAKSRFFQQARHPFRLIVTMLQQQPAVMIQVGWRECNYPPNIIESIRA